MVIKGHRQIQSFEWLRVNSEYREIICTLLLSNMSHSHKPGTLKQSNKKHKGTASSKREQKRSVGPGKVETSAGRKSVKANLSNMAL